MRMTPKRVLVLLLSLAVLLSLCACGQKPEQTPVKENAGTTLGLPAKTDKQKEQENSQESASNEWTQSGKASLALLRDRINVPDILFGMAYLGYVGGLFDNGFEQDFPVWPRDSSQTLLDEYPFIAEIDKDHIIGGAGHLYCIVPVDKNATISINRVQTETPVSGIRRLTRGAILCRASWMGNVIPGTSQNTSIVLRET